MPKAARRRSRARPGPGFADPDYELSVEWIATNAAAERRATRWADPASPSRVLLICGSSRNDGTCPGEMSKTFRLRRLAREVAGAKQASRSTCWT